jgi:hypothetical protein
MCGQSQEERVSVRATRGYSLMAEIGEGSMHTSNLKNIAVFLVCLTLSGSAFAQTKQRARDLGVPFDGMPGPLNAITDVKGVEVGHATLISGDATSPAGADKEARKLTPGGRTKCHFLSVGWFFVIHSSIWL